MVRDLGGRQDIAKFGVPESTSNCTKQLNGGLGHYHAEVSHPAIRFSVIDAGDSLVFRNQISGQCST